MSNVKVFLLCAATAALTIGIFLAIGASQGEPKVTAFSIAGPQQANAGEVIKYSASTVNTSWWLSHIVYQWVVLDDTGIVPHTNLSADTILFPAGTSAKKYFIICTATAHYNFFVRSYVVPLSIAISTTQVGTSPGPNPNPGPTGPLYAIAIFDTNNLQGLPPGQLAIKNSQTIKASLKSLNITWMWQDKSAPAVNSSKWQQLITKYGTPCIIFADSQGNVYNGSGTLPATESDLVTLANKVRSGQ